MHFLLVTHLNPETNYSCEMKTWLSFYWA